MKRTYKVFIASLGFIGALIVGFLVFDGYREKQAVNDACLRRAEYDFARKAWSWESGPETQRKYFSTRDEAVENCVATNK